MLEELLPDKMYSEVTKPVLIFLLFIVAALIVWAARTITVAGILEGILSTFINFLENTRKLIR